MSRSEWLNALATEALERDVRCHDDGRYKNSRLWEDVMSGKGVRKNYSKQKGYTLLEYCAGAALLLSIVWAGMNALGGSLDNYLRRVGTWLDNATFEASPE
ncbi:MAG: hypothetical protein J5J00_08250 [Deltaproteobacteria bacterium]|nr:hypothetical protein [Deltaproteobacteria bacterium]